MVKTFPLRSLKWLNNQDPQSLKKERQPIFPAFGWYIHLPALARIPVLPLPKRALP